MLSEGVIERQVRGARKQRKVGCWCWAGSSSSLFHSLGLLVYGMMLPLFEMALSTQFLLLERTSQTYRGVPHLLLGDSKWSQLDSGS